MIPPGLAFMSVSPKAWKFAETATLPHYYFNLKKEKKSGDAGESSWTPSTALILALAEALRYVKQIGMANLIENAQLLARPRARRSTELGLELFAPGSPGSSVTAVKAPAGMDSGVIVKEFRNRFGAIIANGQGSHEGADFPHRAPGLLRFRGPVRGGRGASRSFSRPTGCRWSTAPAWRPCRKFTSAPRRSRRPRARNRTRKTDRRCQSNEYTDRRASGAGRH